jgi:hypothetical protein
MQPTSCAQVDDSRKTLSCAVTELQKDIEQERQQHEAAHPDTPWDAPEIGVFVVHNKQRMKLAQLPESIMRNRCVAAAAAAAVGACRVGWLRVHTCLQQCSAFEQMCAPTKREGLLVVRPDPHRGVWAYL